MAAPTSLCRCTLGVCWGARGVRIGGVEATCRRKALLASTPTKEGGHCRDYPPLRRYGAGPWTMWVPVVLRGRG